MDAAKLRERKAQLEKERETVRQQAQAQIDRLTGAIAMLDELIGLEVEQTHDEQPAAV